MLEKNLLLTNYCVVVSIYFIGVLTCHSYAFGSVSSLLVLPYRSSTLTHPDRTVPLFIFLLRAPPSAASLCLFNHSVIVDNYGCVWLFIFIAIDTNPLFKQWLSTCILGYTSTSPVWSPCSEITQLRSLGVSEARAVYCQIMLQKGCISLDSHKPSGGDTLLLRACQP